MRRKNTPVDLKDARTLHREYTTECRRVLADMRGEEFVEDEPAPEPQEEAQLKTLDTVIDEEEKTVGEPRPEHVDTAAVTSKVPEGPVPTYENLDHEKLLIKKLDDLLKRPTKADKNICFGGVEIAF